MRQVEHYLRQAKAARDLAADAETEKARSHFVTIAEEWENLAKERLSLLQLKLEKVGGDALLIATQVPEAPSSKPDGSGNPSP